MIPEKAKDLWINEAKKAMLGINDENSAAALADNMEEYVRFRTITESRHLFKKYDIKNKKVLDLGCGPGRLTFLFAKKAKKVIGVDQCSDFITIANRQKDKQKIQNISFIYSSIQDFVAVNNEQFDLIFIGGVLMYMNDKDVCQVLQNLKKNVNKQKGLIIVREPVNCKNQRENSEVDIKRTKEEYVQIFKKKGFELTYVRETFMHCPLFQYYKKLPLKIRMKKLSRLFFRTLFTFNAFVDPLFFKLGYTYKKRINKKWRIKQYFFFIKLELSESLTSRR